MREAARRIEAARDQIVRRVADGKLLLAAGALVFVVACLVPHRGRWDLPWAMGIGPSMLGGEAKQLGDFATDVVGFRRLVDGRDPYPVLGQALREIGIDWDLPHRSTHPPTAYLFAAPVAFLPSSTGARVWGAVGYVLVFATLLLYGLRARAALGLALAATAWKPFAGSFPQLTFVWLAALAACWRLRDRRPFWAGAAIGLAALTKLTPAGVLGWFVFQRRWRAAVGAAAVVAGALLAVWLLSPGSFARYLGVRETIRDIVLRRDNASPVGHALAAGLLAQAALAAAVLALVARNLGALFAPGRAPDYAFFLYSYLAVLVLPISWSYSFAPILPVLGWFALRGRAAHLVLATGIFFALGIHPAFGSTWMWIHMLSIGILFLLEPPAVAEAAVQGGAERPTP